jgi:hypothetical protein
VFDGDDAGGAADPGRRPLRLGPRSTYIAKPPFFDGSAAEPGPVGDIAAPASSPSWATR